MKRILLSTIAIATISNLAYADNNKNILEKTNGYVRLGYQNDTKGNIDLAIGGKLHTETKKWNNLSLGLSFYTTNPIARLNDETKTGYTFFSSNNESYSILGEAYIKGQFKNTLIKIGRQELDTPYADTDDLGMIPNTFGAALIQNKNIKNTTLTALYIRNMAGIDADIPQRFTNTGMKNGVYAIGAEYEKDNLALQGWYYNIKDSENRSFTYFDTTYSGKSENFEYETGGQFATQQALKNDPNKNAKIYGIQISGKYKPSGLTLTLAYNKDNGTAADNGFGGGPFYTSAEFLTLADAGADGKVYAASGEWDTSAVGIDGITFGAGYFLLKDKNNDKAHEVDISLAYDYNNNLSLSAVYSNINNFNSNNNFKNIRTFINYKF